MIDKCKECGGDLSTSATRCPHCGAPIFQFSKRKRLTFRLLAFFLGVFGAHNFYIGRVGRGVFQLVITTLTLGAGGWITFPWAIIEMLTVYQDADGNTLKPYSD